MLICIWIENGLIASFALVYEFRKLTNYWRQTLSIRTTKYAAKSVIVHNIFSALLYESDRVHSCFASFVSCWILYNILLSDHLIVLLLWSIQDFDVGCSFAIISRWNDSAIDRHLHVQNGLIQKIFALSPWKSLDFQIFWYIRYWIFRKSLDFQIFLIHSVLDF